MRHNLILSGQALLPLILLAPAVAAGGSGYPIRPIPFTDVRVQDDFWRERIETNRVATIPHALDQCEATGRLANFRRAGGLEEGGFQGTFFNDSDVYKIVQGACYSLALQPDAAIERRVDELISWFAAAQEEDGYLYTARTLQDSRYTPPGGTARWSDIRNGHELYCLGHMFEAAAAHYQVTGKRSFLEVATRAADLVCEVFNAEGNRYPPGHQEIEIGLVSLYRVTGEAKYLDQAWFFLEERGRSDGHPLFGSYCQDHEPVAQQAEAVGHSVRAMYLYSGMADVAAARDYRPYVDALDRIWEDVLDYKFYLTGGIGAAGGHEGYGQAYDLPNLVAYCETCSQIASVLWNQRMFLHHGDAKYIDILEQTLYNALISGVSLDGTKFFYPNPLESDGRHARSPWFGCACCPSNIPRFIPQVPGLIYAHARDAIYLNLFVQGTTSIQLADQAVKLTQRTRYPWEGDVTLTVTPERPGRPFTLLVRAPGWARNKVVASDLYRFSQPVVDGVVIKVNGRTLTPDLDKGYLSIRRRWRAGDLVEIALPMPVRRVLSHPEVRDNRGKIALQRGPLVYCVEAPDVADGKVVNLMLPDAEPVYADWRGDLLGGVNVLTATARSLRWSRNGDKILSEKTPFVAVPYYAWAHRGRGEMAVWIARGEAGARPLAAATIASRGTPSASKGDAKALNDQREPKSSGDHSNRFLHWWPNKGTQEWVRYEWTAPTRVSAVEVYWFDDTGRGACRLPASWTLLYRDAGKWKEVPEPSGYGCAGDTYNRTTFSPVTTDALRIEVRSRADWAGGIHEWRVE